MTTAEQPRIRLGLSLPNRGVLFGMPTDLLLRTAEEAEAARCFDSVWVGDNFLSKPRLESVVLLSALAARTRRLRLGVICLATFPMRHPLPFAIQWASLDVLSGGRTILAVCMGGSSKAGRKFAIELQAMGVQDDERVPRMIEGVKLLRLLWGEGPVTYKGRFYAFEEVEAYPKPAQARVPIVMAVNPSPQADPETVELGLRRVARHADGWQTDGTPAPVFKERWARIRELAAEYGRADEVTDSSLHLMVNIDDDAERAYQRSIEFLGHYYGMGAITREKLDAWLAYGPPGAVIEKMNEFIDAGCSTLVVRFTSNDQHVQLERFSRDVAPAFENVRIVPSA